MPMMHIVNLDHHTKNIYTALKMQSLAECQAVLHGHQLKAFRESSLVLPCSRFSLVAWQGEKRLVTLRILSSMKVGEHWMHCTVEVPHMHMKPGMCHIKSIRCRWKLLIESGDKPCSWEKPWGLNSSGSSKCPALFAIWHWSPSTEWRHIFHNTHTWVVYLRERTVWHRYHIAAMYYITESLLCTVNACRNCTNMREQVFERS